MSFSDQTTNMLRKIQAQLVDASYTRAKLLGWFKAIGNIRDIGEGILKHTFTKIEKMEPGEIISDLSALPTSVPKFTEQTTSVLTIGTKVALSMDLVDRYANNNLIEIDVNKVIDTQLKAFTEQIDQFLAYGDSYKTPRTGDKNAGEDFAKGIFNGGTTFAAGDGKDNIMNAAGDYQSTVANAIIALENAGFESEVGYYMFSDNTTYHTAELGVHQLNTYTFTNERRAIDANKDIIKWVSSTHFTDASGTKRIVITTPYSRPIPDGGDKQIFAYRLIRGYNLKVTPLYGGGLSGKGRYEWIILWSGAIEILNSGAIQSSGALTL